MSNTAYLLGMQAFASGAINFPSDNIKVMLVNNSYTANFTTDQWQSTIPGGDVIFTSGNLSGNAATLGTLSASNLTMVNVNPTGSQGYYLVLFKDTGTPGTSPLFLYIDTATNLPITPNGGNITVAWDTGANKIMTLFSALPDKVKNDQGLLGKLADWLNGLRIPADRTPSGLWVCKPALLQGPAPLIVI